jgi:diguanylate cyclase (GGDEF)-like protein
MAVLRTLPSLPAAALRVVELAGNPDADMTATAAAISVDPALTAKILRIANSPLYTNTRKTENLRQALTLLGLNATLTLALGFSLSHAFRSSLGRSIDRDMIWRRSVLSAGTCRLIATRLNLAHTEEAMLGGLLQDIGMLALADIAPESYAPLLAEAECHADLPALERKAYGCDHAEVGAWMAKAWGLPDYLEAALFESDSPSPTSRFNAVVAVSGIIADIWLRKDPRAARNDAQAAVERLLGLGHSDCAELLVGVAESIPDVSAMFDIHVVDAEHAASILDHARELLVIRNLRQLDDAMRRRDDDEHMHDHVRKLEEKARRDSLTGAYNRAHLDEMLRKEYSIAVEHGWPLSLAFFDLDDFKNINDRYGHLVGDEVLRQFAQLLMRSLRSRDIVARYGGEEFLIVLPGIDRDDASEVLQRVVSMVSTTPLAEVDGEVIKVTVSAGLAVADEHRRFASVEELLREADRALYSAKRNGRNRLVAQGDAESGAVLS